MTYPIQPPNQNPLSPGEARGEGVPATNYELQATSFFPFSFPVPAAQQGDQLSAFSYRKANTMPLILVFTIGLFIGANFGLLMFGLLQTADHKD